MKTKSSISWLSQALVLATLIAGTVLGNFSAAWAADSYGIQSLSYSGVSNPPTSDKPQSKLWWNDGSWWADMWKSGSGWHIYRLDRGTKTWVDTGLLNDSRSNTLADTLWDGTHLYIASHVVTISGDTSPVASASGQPAKLYRYSYSGGNYTLDSGFPTTITNNSSESMTIDVDSTGALWATWTQVAGNSTSGFTSTVYVNYSAPGGTGWATPFVIPVADPYPAPDDISAVVAFGQNKIGVMWSDQPNGAVYWATRTDGTAPTTASSWNVQPAIQGKGQADDHLNLKTLQADTTGRVFAAVKTGLNDTSSDPTLPQLLLLVFKPGTGSFSKSTISTTGDCVSRPQILLDTQNNLVHAFQTAPSTSVSGCAYSGVAGSIYEKTASMDNPVFGSGRGTPVIQDAASANMNNVTTTKQSVNSTTGLVVMASDHVAKRYWFADRGLDSVTAAPVASFTAAPTTGTAPLDVSFTDTSTGTPTSWSWDFGDGGTSTLQNPSHTYSAAGTYTATLTATNSGGSTSATSTITVNPAAPAGGVTVVGSTTTYSGSAASDAVALTVPSGTTAGDVLISAVTADRNPSMASVPAGWTPIVNALGINSSSRTGARVFAYYHVVGPSDPSTYTWTLSTAVKWGAGVTAYRGVDNATPLDSPVATTVNATYSATSITVPSVTTATDGAMLIGGVGCDCTSPVVSPPSGWTERWEAAGGQIAELADQPQTTAGATGTTTWTLSATRAVAAWRTALKPASGSVAPAPAAPVASFTAAPTSGTAPLPVSFTDTSTGSPTSWAWDFGDTGTSTAQNPTHTYSAAGTFTATLTATNSAGSTSATSTITVNPATPAGEVTVVGSSTTYSATASATVALTAPSGTTAGDVLIASITGDFNPSMASVPAGWTPIVNALGINSSSTSGARVFAYYHVVGSSDPSTYIWTFSNAVKWGAGMTAYRGVNNTTPLDSPVVTAVNASYTATSITVPSITTASNGAMLIGGVGCDCGLPVVSPPSGWTERFESLGGQLAELADQAQATAGATGTTTWTLSATRGVAAWRTALKPAS